MPVSELGDAPLEPARDVIRRIFPAGQLTDAFDSDGNVVKAVRTDRFDPIAGRRESLDQRGGSAAIPCKDQRRREDRELLLIDSECVADDGNLQRFGRIVRVGADADEVLTGAGREDEFREMRRKRHDPQRIAGGI